MGIELLFIAMLFVWGAIMVYLLYLHLRQRRLIRISSQLTRIIDSMKKKQ